jgi:hypothetical protein
MTTLDPTAAPLVLRLFGPFEVFAEGNPLPHLCTQKGRWLLALLALRAGSPVARDWLAGTLWPDSPQSQALGSLRRSLTDLHSALARRAGSRSPLRLRGLALSTILPSIRPRCCPHDPAIVSSYCVAGTSSPPLLGGGSDG